MMNDLNDFDALINQDLPPAAADKTPDPKTEKELADLDRQERKLQNDAARQKNKREKEECIFRPIVNTDSD